MNKYIEDIQLAIGFWLLNVWRCFVPFMWEDDDLEPARAGLPYRYADGGLCGCRDCKASLRLPPDADVEPIYTIGTYEPVGWYHYKGPLPQAEHDIPQAVYPEWSRNVV